MQPVDLCDRVRLAPAELGASADEVHCPGVEGDNLAAAALRASASARAGRAPRCASSSRSASRSPPGWRAAPRTRRRRCASRRARRAVRDDALLREIAVTLGADVPAQVRPRRYLATGAGEVLHALPDPAPFGILVVRSRTGSRPPTCSARRTG